MEVFFKFGGRIERFRSIVGEKVREIEVVGLCTALGMRPQARTD